MLKNIKILHTNDIHSDYESMAQIASLIKYIKNDNTLIIDAGDNADFMRTETEGTMGEISSQILNSIGYDARILGNNEGFAGIDKIRHICETSKVPVITSNLYDLKGNKFEWLEDFVIKKVNDKKVLILGVTAPYNVFYELSGIHASNPLEEIEKVLKEKQGEYNVCLLISHLGFKRDKDIAEKLDSIDIIVGGHSHTELDKPIMINNTIIAQAGKYGDYIGEINLVIDDENNVKSYEGRLISTKAIKYDKKILDIIDEYREKSEKHLGKTLYSIDSNLSHYIEKEDDITNLLADALWDYVPSDFGIINSGVLNKGIKKGKVSKKLLLEICPSPLNPTYYEIKGKHIISALEKSLLSEYNNKDGKGAGFRGQYLGNLQVSDNVKVTYDSNNSNMNKIKSILIDDKEIDKEKIYKIATSDYIQRGTGYNDFKSGKNEKFYPEYLREILEKYLNRNEFIQKSKIKRFNKIR